jgi:hypothetical protein
MYYPDSNTVVVMAVSPLLHKYEASPALGVDSTTESPAQTAPTMFEVVKTDGVVSRAT